ncbi:MAG: hypothetical protein DWQ19_11485 [Crenarchaeota archaeon]|nr:MAG: hypothetical protein DWQ19_11485 [Thermoproteota archaeon]
MNEFQRMLEQANRLPEGDIVKGNLYESLRRRCRENPEDLKWLEEQLPDGYRLIPPMTKLENSSQTS